MKKNIFALMVLLFSMIQYNMAQDPVVISFSDETTDGGTVTVDITADNFTNISGMQLFIEWDSTVLEFNAISNINGELDGFNSSSFAKPPSIPEGHVNVSWFSTNPFGDSENLPDGSLLFSIELTAVGDPCDETDFQLVDYNGQPNEAYDGDFNEVEVQFNEGTVMIPGEDCGGGNGDQYGLGLIVEETSDLPGSYVCIGITVDSFVNINSAQFAVEYDETILEFVQHVDGPLTDELVNPTGDNYIRFLWLVPADENPNTLPDGTTLIEFCFNVIGELGECAPIEVVSINEPPALEIEFINGDGQVVDYYTDPADFCVGDNPTPPVTFIASDEVGEQNDEICIDITSLNFEDIGSFQWAFTWDNSVMSYNGLGTTNNINISDTDINPVANDVLRVSWLPTTAVTKPDGTILFQLCFDLVGECDESTVAEFTNDGGSFQIEVGNGDGEPLPYDVQNGSAAIECACQISYTRQHVKCNGDEDGSIFITLTGCDAESFEWNTGQTTQNLQGIGAGTYRLTVTLVGGGEVVSDVITISEPAAISVNETITNVSCAEDGTISLDVSGGTAGYDFEWSPNVSSENVADGLEAGTYSVTVTDSQGCTFTRTYGVSSEIPDLNVDGNMTDITCKDADDGTISVTPSDGCPGYDIAWSDGEGAGEFEREDLAAGTYMATVTDDKGQTETISFSVTNPDEALNIVIEEITFAYIGGADGSIDITATGGEGDYEFAWSNGAETEDISAGAGTYTVFVTDSRGCTVNETYEIVEIYETIELTATAAENLFNGYGVSCFGACDGKINMSVTGNPFTLYVDGEEVEPFDEFPQLNFCPGDYVISVEDIYGNEDAQTVTITEPDPLEIMQVDSTCSNGDDGLLTVSVEGGVGDYSFDWGVSGDFDETVEGLAVGTYSVIVTDENNCQAVLDNMEVVSCYDGPCFVASPVITPNNDTYNDNFIVKCLEDYPNNKFDVFDRWGRKVYSESNYDGTSWEGMGTDGELDEGSYMWVITAVLGNGDERQYKGTVTILK